MENDINNELPSTTKLPVGSIVTLKKTDDEKFLIVSRLPITQQDDNKVYFDYGATILPMGMSGEQIFFFNAEDISEIVYPPYEDTNTISFQNALEQYLSEHNKDLTKGNSKLASKDERNSSKDKETQAQNDLSQLLKKRQDSLYQQPN